MSTMLKSRSVALDPKRHAFQTKFGVGVTVATLVLFGGLSLLYGVPEDASLATSSQRMLEEDDGTTDYRSYSCNDLFQTVPQAGAAQCAFATTCNQGYGLWAHFVFCSTWLSRNVLIMCISPFVVLWLVLLFRMLGSTAEDYFSPALEMFAVKLRLPPRFAGVTLLALGNGAADVSATVSAITNDPENGYKLSLGALTGAAMVIGAVVSAGVVLVAGGVPCRGALVRDVAALGLAVLVVWKELGTGLMTGETVTLFLAMYVAFVMLVLLADIYHRAVVLPRRQLLAVERERQRQLQGETWHSDSLRQQQQEESTAVPPESQFSHVLTAFFNYDNPPSSASANAFGNNTDGGMGIDSEVLAAEEHILLHGTHGILGGRRGHSPARLLTDDDGAVTENEMSYDMMQDQMDAVCVDPSVGMTATGWTEAWEEGKAEVRRHGEALWDDVAYNGDLDVLSKYLLVLEFPTTVLRQATVSIPCEGYYNRGILALTLAVSPLWMAFYLNRAFGIAVWQTGQIWFGVYWLLAAVAAVGVLRHAPGGSGDSVMPSLWVATPVALYGFVIAASWIDTIADQLVGVLAFVGIVLKIPGPIVGLTILAWGNSMSDLSADITMARKGLANMAMTACFAGPLFNILVGLGMGFSSLAAQTGQSTREVSVSPSIATGFLFITVNSAVILVTGLWLGKGMIPKKYGYVALTLYSIYLIVSIYVQYSKHSS